MTSPALSSIARGVPDVDLLRALAATNRKALERMISLCIDILDEVDGDADAQDGDSAEDEPVAWFNDPNWLRQSMPFCGAGCPVSEPDSGEQPIGTFRPQCQSIFGKAGEV